MCAWNEDLQRPKKNGGSALPGPEQEAILQTGLETMGRHLRIAVLDVCRGLLFVQSALSGRLKPIIAVRTLIAPSSSPAAEPQCSG